MGHSSSLCSCHRPSRSDEEIPVQDPTRNNYLGHEFRALSVKYLCSELMEEITECGLGRESTLYEMNDCFIMAKSAATKCPRTGKIGAAYVDCVSAADKVGLATIMLSYTWGYKIGDIADTLFNFCADNDMPIVRTYVWMCWACINQHRVKETQQTGEVVPFEVFSKEFGTRVRGIGRILAMVAPWHDPFYVKRAWCNFELYTAIESNVDISLAMPPREAKDFCSTVTAGGDWAKVMWSSLAHVDVERAQASVLSDKTNIFRAIQEGPGFHKLNTVITSRLHKWMVEASKTFFDTCVEESKLETKTLFEMATEIGDLLSKVEELHTAKKVYQQALEMCKQMGQMESEDGAELLKDLGSVDCRLGDKPFGLKRYEEAYAIRKKLKSTQSRGCAKLMLSIGVTKRDLKDLEGAYEALCESLSIRESLGELETTGGANLLSSMGVVKIMSGDADEAVKLYNQAKEIHVKNDSIFSMDGAKLYRNIGQAHYDNSKYDEACQALDMAVNILERTGCAGSGTYEDVVKQRDMFERSRRQPTGQELSTPQVL